MIFLIQKKTKVVTAVSFSFVLCAGVGWLEEYIIVSVSSGWRYPRP